MKKNRMKSNFKRIEAEKDLKKADSTFSKIILQRKKTIFEAAAVANDNKQC